MNSPQNKLLLIPGFGMEATFFDYLTIHNWKIVIISPGWDNHRSWDDVLNCVSSQLDGELKKESRELVVYGFSIGADILMDLFNQDSLILPDKARIIFAEPNIGKETCNITELVFLHPTYVEWKADIESRIISPS